MNRLTLAGFSFIAVLLIAAIIGPAPAGAGQGAVGDVNALEAANDGSGSQTASHGAVFQLPCDTNVPRILAATPVWQRPTTLFGHARSGRRMARPRSRLAPRLRTARSCARARTRSLLGARVSSCSPTSRGC